jgi:hypothetical protein
MFGAILNGTLGTTEAETIGGDWRERVECSERAQPGKLESASFKSASSSRWPNWPCMLVLPPSLFWSSSTAPLHSSWSLDFWAAGFFSGSLIIRMGFLHLGSGIHPLGYENTRLHINKEGRRFAAILSPSAYVTTVRGTPIPDWSKSTTLCVAAQKNESAPVSRGTLVRTALPRGLLITRLGPFRRVVNGTSVLSIDTAYLARFRRLVLLREAPHQNHSSALRIPLGNSNQSRDKSHCCGEHGNRSDPPKYVHTSGVHPSSHNLAVRGNEHNDEHQKRRRDPLHD